MWRRQPWPQRGDGSPDVSFTLRLAGDYSRPSGTTSTRSSVPPATRIEQPTCYSPWSCTTLSTKRLPTSPTPLSPSLCPTLKSRSAVPHRRKPAQASKWTFELKVIFPHPRSSLTGNHRVRLRGNRLSVTNKDYPFPYGRRCIGIETARTFSTAIVASPRRNLPRLAALSWKPSSPLLIRTMQKFEQGKQLRDRVFFISRSA